MRHRFLFATVMLAATAAAQTTSTVPRRTTARHTTATKTAAPAANPADNPPNVPKVAGTPQNLYALRYIDTEVGAGPLAESRKFYTVHYTGWLTDGTKFDSSHDHPGGEPIVFPYGARRVIPGWDTGFEGMHVGGKRRLFIPYQLAYGESGRPPVIPAKADLIFDIELVAQSDTPPQSKPAPAAAEPAQDSSQTGHSEGLPAGSQPKAAPAPAQPETAPKPQAPPKPQ
ncbi:MAG: FKBP-type peptidyl-prolyl cis-trans isomerase [Acidobacteria bacterium]|nr:FKBP-type peptidyl-prolyl cis-trans isomerase [Acidobacteriota bacterium]